jgi:hypothetical protein
MRDAIPTETNNFLSVRIRSWFWRHKSFDYFTPFRVRDADYGRFLNIRVLVKNAFYFDS